MLLLYLAKNEDAEAYKKIAEQGMDLLHPVRIRGQTHRPDINIPYHATIKLFDTTKDKPEHAHDVASKLELNPPDPKQLRIEPVTMKGRTGYTIHALKLYGPHADQMKEHHKKFSHLGFQEAYDYHPHISVDKALWDHIVDSKAQTAHEAGIEFMPAELHHKMKVVASYKPKVALPMGGEIPAKDKLAASEKLEIVRETISLNSELQQHLKAIRLPDQYLANYLQDNPSLEKEVMKKHEERLKHHFGDDLRLIQIAWEQGLQAAYKAKEK